MMAEAERSTRDAVARAEANARAEAREEAARVSEREMARKLDEMAQAAAEASIDEAAVDAMRAQVVELSRSLEAERKQRHEAETATLVAEEAVAVVVRRLRKAEEGAEGREAERQQELQSTGGARAVASSARRRGTRPRASRNVGARWS